MSENKIIDIIKLCLSIDIKASTIYAEMADLSDSMELNSFWKNMSLEEERHVLFWEQMVLLADQNAIPQIFDDFDKIKSELDSTKNKVDILSSEVKHPMSDISRMFLIAYRMEFYLLHPAFEKLFFFAGHADLSAPNPEEAYENHLKEFIEALTKYGKATPEMELLGETLERLWLENRNLAKQSMTDLLTGLLNRRGFFSSIQPLMYFAQRNKLTVGILMIDIDDFKQINDSYGHKKGDAILSLVAKILSKSKRTSDIIGRFGGDEFVIYLSSVNPDELFHVADKIRESVKNTENEYGLPVTISVGAASHMFEKNIEKELNELIEAADSCLYNSKKEGKNRVTIYEK